MERNGASVVRAGLILLLLMVLGVHTACDGLSERGPLAPRRSSPESADKPKGGDKDPEPETEKDPEPPKKEDKAPEKAPDEIDPVKVPPIEDGADAGEEEAPDASEDASEEDAGEEITGKDADLTIVESTMATSVEDRKAKGKNTVFDTGVGRVVAYVVIKNKGEPTTVKMVWKKAGKPIFDIDVKVGNSKAWRTWSRKQVRARDKGKWSVEVVGPEGGVLTTLPFEIVAAQERGGAGDGAGSDR